MQFAMIGVVNVYANQTLLVEDVIDAHQEPTALVQLDVDVS